uniref:Uncharacterized protein n=1 Tax=Guillardia theta (strain CCMP2712) TaxID=905079 RepID=A0A0C3TUX5_GUITC
MAEVERLCLPSNRIKEIGVKGMMGNLVELFLQDNMIVRLDGIGCARRLRRLWLTSNELQDISEVGQLSDLRELWMQDNNLSEEELWAVKDLEHLSCLDVTGNPISS